MYGCVFTDAEMSGVERRYAGIDQSPWLKSITRLRSASNATVIAEMRKIVSNCIKLYRYSYE